jgi:metallo-beta-lactamase family protein
VKIHGRYVRVKCEIALLDGMSAHADRGELMEWAAALSPRPRATFVVHGERTQAEALRRALADELGHQAHVPMLGHEVTIG